MPKRPKKKYNRPKKIYDIITIKEENALMTNYGLKSRREVWRANFEICKIRDLAKSLITHDEAEKKEFVERQAKKGFSVAQLQDILALNKEDRLKRRLQTIIAQKFNLAPKLARQLITHKHVKIDGRRINSPAHLTTIKEEAGMELALALPVKEVVSAEEKQILEQMKNHQVKPEEKEE
jgi:small subunit ribosomal protein S4